MSKEKKNKKTLGKMTDEEYADFKRGAPRGKLKRYHGSVKELKKMTDEEYENLPNGNRGFYEQFKK